MVRCMKTTTLTTGSEKIDDATAAFFGEHADAFRKYIETGTAATAAERATRAARANDRKIRWALISEATYWLARWERFGAVC